MDDDLNRARDIIMAHIKSEQPYGQFEPAVTFYDKKGYKVYERRGSFPSDRLGHTPIHAGWNVDKYREGNTLSLRFSNISEHIWYVIEGDQPYKDRWDISGPVVWWWGAPLPWHPTPPAKPGSTILPSVTRKTPTLNRFPSRVAEKSERDVGMAVFEGIGDYIVELFQDVGGRR